jgi:hypothetical protein
MSEQNPTEVLSFRAVVFDKNDPASIHHLISKHLSDCITNIPINILSLPYEDLKKNVRPSPVLDALRTSFWLEYNRAVFQNFTHLVIDRVYSGICTKEYFYTYVCKTPLLLAWVMFPPNEYSAMLETLLKVSLDRMHELVNLPFIKENGLVDHRTIALVLKTFEMLDNRLHGTPVQKTESRNLNFNLNAKPIDVSQKRTELLETSLSKRVKELQNRERQLAERGFGPTIIQSEETPTGD